MHHTGERFTQIVIITHNIGRSLFPFVENVYFLLDLVTSSCKWSLPVCLNVSFPVNIFISCRNGHFLLKCSPHDEIFTYSYNVHILLGMLTYCLACPYPVDHAHIMFHMAKPYETYLYPAWHAHILFHMATSSLTWSHLVGHAHILFDILTSCMTCSHPIWHAHNLFDMPTSCFTWSHPIGNVLTFTFSVVCKAALLTFIFCV